MIKLQANFFQIFKLVFQTFDFVQFNDYSEEFKNLESCFTKLIMMIIIIVSLFLIVLVVKKNIFYIFFENFYYYD